MLVDMLANYILDPLVILELSLALVVVALALLLDPLDRPHSARMQWWLQTPETLHVWRAPLVWLCVTVSAKRRQGTLYILHLFGRFTENLAV